MVKDFTLSSPPQKKHVEITQYKSVIFSLMNNRKRLLDGQQKGAQILLLVSKTELFPSVPLTADPSSLTALTIVSANSQAVFAGMARSYDTTLGVGHAGRNTTAGPGHARDWREN